MKQHEVQIANELKRLEKQRLQRRQEVKMRVEKSKISKEKFNKERAQNAKEIKKLTQRNLSRKVHHGFPELEQKDYSKELKELKEFYQPINRSVLISHQQSYEKLKKIKEAEYKQKRDKFYHPPGTLHSS